MVKSTDEIKELVAWAVKNKVKSLKIDNIQFELSELAFLEDVPQAIPELPSQVAGDTLTDTEQVDPAEDEELLYWSTLK